MKKICSLLVTISIVFTTGYASNPDWGQTGHRTIGKIAEPYLKNKTKRKIAEILDGQSLALVSTFGDDIKSDDRYDNLNTWHYVNMPFEVDYQHSEKNTDGDLVTGIEKCKSVILDENATKEEKAFYLKLLVHFIGDLHQPMHVGRKEDKGGNTIQVQWFGSGTNLHSVWDTKMIESFNMSYTELAENVDEVSKETVANLQKGTIIDWVNDTHIYAKKVYESTEVGEKLGYNYMYQYFSLTQSQLQKGGIRLAKVLNELFG
jgi:hypothetical protein